ncbi:ThuA domain-containing protein [Roseateles sp.]|uniref:ThuA domain-containing protein n=1 Tax=Roseateles sp. TaxID=1971397 RepID=UPI003266787A
MKRFFWITCLAALASVFVTDAMAAPARKILVVTTTLGFRHASIETAERVLASLGESSGTFEVELASVAPIGNGESETYKEQVRAMLERKLNAAALKRYDGIVFASTTGELPLPDKDAFIQWVWDGGAFIGIHSASDTLHGYRPYADMLGGEFDYHREQVRIEAINRDASHPANRHLPAIWNLDGQLEEIYVIKNYRPAQVQELLALDRHPNTGAPGNFPISWSREFGKGRVFYTALGHNEAVWRMPAFQQHLLGGIEWALGLR